MSDRSGAAGGPRLLRPWEIAAIVAAVLVAIAAVGAILFAAGWMPDRAARFGQRLQAQTRARLTLRAVNHSLASRQPGPVPPTVIGINPTSPRLAHSFANLVLASRWQTGGPKGSKRGKFPAELLDRNGELIALPPGQSAIRRLLLPGLGQTFRIECRYAGKGSVALNGRDATLRSAAPHRLQFDWTPDARRRPLALEIGAIDPADPIRAIDCRLAGTDPAARFSPAFVAWMKQFKVLRMMGWQGNNANASVTWSSRHTPRSFDIADGDGVAIEDMVALSLATGAAPWFNIPWNADDDYVRRFARYVHDRLPADRAVYVELANEVWNTRFSVARQASAEGRQRKLAHGGREAGLLRYAERTAEVMEIWSAAFADNPRRLVRVLASQHVNPFTTALLFGYRDTAAHVDALATAPYFGLSAGSRPTDLAAVFAGLYGAADRAIANARRQQAIAARYGKRYIAYEAGQGVVLEDIDLAERIQRDPRMYDLTRHFMRAWREQVGDLLMMFGTVFRTNKYGSWGLREYDGQPPSAAPKLRAVDDELANAR